MNAADDLAATLDAVAEFVRRYVVLGDSQLVAASLWVFHTWTLDAADVTPYLAITSAEKRSGKSRLLDVLALLARDPLSTVSISDAALFRVIADRQPTALFDEVDSIFGPKARDREDLRGMLNAGWRRGAMCYRMNGATMQLQTFPVFCPKAFAAIGELPDTVADRSITIRMERRMRNESIERFRVREVPVEADPIRQALESLGASYKPTLTAARPDLASMDDVLDDRAQDIWEPLFAIADLAGNGWVERARSSAVNLSGGRDRDDDSLGTKLLADLYAIFHVDGSPQRYRTSDLIAQLAEIEESPWGDWHGKVVTAQVLSRLLKPYRIRTMPVRTTDGPVKGYKVEQFADAFARFLPPQASPGVTRVTSVTPDCPCENDCNPSNPCNPQTPPAGDADNIINLFHNTAPDNIATDDDADEWAS